MKLPIAVGIVGCGYWGPNLARIFSGSAQAHLTALCDPAIERRRHMQGLHPQVAVFDNFCAMLANRDLDAIVIATPAKTHFAIAKASLLAGKHVLVEKPMASTSRECKELIEIARERSLILMAGHTYLYSEAVAKIAEIVASGEQRRARAEHHQPDQDRRLAADPVGEEPQRDRRDPPYRARRAQSGARRHGGTAASARHRRRALPHRP